MPLIESQPDALANVYAQSIFEMAEAQGGRARLEELAGEFDELVEVTRQHPQLSEFLASRILSTDDRERSIRNIFGGKISDLLLHFILMLNRKERLNHFLPIANAFDVMVQEKFGRVEIDIFTPSQVDQSQLAQIRSKLEQAIRRELVIHTYVDSSMIGGMKMQVGDKLIDASIATQLRKVRDKLTPDGLANVRNRADEMMDRDRDSDG